MPLPKPLKQQRTKQINITVTEAFKRRVERLAALAENRPGPTHLARVILEEGVEQREKQLRLYLLHHGQQAAEVGAK